MAYSGSDFNEITTRAKGCFGTFPLQSLDLLGYNNFQSGKTMGRKAEASTPSRGGSKDQDQAQSEARIAIIDEFGRLDTELTRFKSMEQRRNELRGWILGWYPFLPADATQEIEGHRYSIEITRKDNMTVVGDEGKKKLKAFWGLAEFLKRCQITLKQLDGIPKDRHGEYTETSRSGPRHLRVTAKTAETAAG